MAPRHHRNTQLGVGWTPTRFERRLTHKALAELFMLVFETHGMWTAGLERFGKRLFTLPTEHGTPNGAERQLADHLDGLGDPQWALVLTDYFRRTSIWMTWPRHLGWFRRERAEYHARQERYRCIGTTKVHQLPDASWVLVCPRTLFAVGPDGALTSEERHKLLGAA